MIDSCGHHVRKSRTLLELARRRNDKKLGIAVWNDSLVVLYTFL